VQALPQALDQLCRERLADYKRPKRTLVLAALPLLPIGKVDRQALRALATQPGTVP
jgi:non-ribosomal peptide synthetase component E (peptide arylation enzyme)